MTPAGRATQSANLPIAILGVPFDNVTTSDTLAIIGEMIASRRPHYLVTANVDFVVQARRDVELRRILLDAHLVVADGMPLVWASRWLGNPLPERVTGSGMTPLLLAEAAARGWRVFFLGGTEQSVAQAAANSRAKHPTLQVAGAYSPPFRPLIEMDHEDILRRLREARPDILLVAFGCPKQEKWLNMHYRASGVPVAIGVGATIDFLAGTVKRAPVWMQQAGLEWIFRLLQEPRRLFRRYVTDFYVFGWAILRQLRALRNGRVAPGGSRAVRVVPIPDQEAVSITLPQRLDVATVEADTQTWRELTDRSVDVMLDASALRGIDSTGVGVLAHLQKALRETERHLVLVAPTKTLSRALGLMGLAEFFPLAPDLASALQLLESRRRESNVAACPTGADPGPGVAWRGEITAANVEAVAQATLPRLAQAKDRFTVDLSAVRFVDSSGIGLMVRLRKEASGQNVALQFVGASESVRNVARLLRLEGVLFGKES